MPTPNKNTYAAAPLTLVPNATGKLIGIDMLGVFPNGGLTGTPTVTCVSASQSYANGATVSTGDLTIGSPIVNSNPFTNTANGRLVADGQGVEVQIACATVDGGNYLLQVLVSDGTSEDGLFCPLQVRGAGQTPP